MQTRSSRLSLALLTLLACAWLCAPAPSRAAGTGVSAGGGGVGETLVLIVGRGLSLGGVSASIAQRIFRGEPTDLAGARMVPFNYAPDHALRRAFDQAVLGMSPDEVGRYWVDRRIRGQGMPPRTVPSAAVARAVVARLPGAIAYVTSNELDSSVRALQIDGKSHDDPAYAYRIGRR